MRATRFLLAGLAAGMLTAAPARAQGRAATATVRRAIEAANAAATSAFNGGNPRAYATAYAANAVMMPPNMKALNGRQAISDWWQGAYDAGYRNLAITTSDVIVRGDLAVESGSYRGEIQPKTPGTPVGHDSGKYVVVWQRNASGRWMM